MNRFGAGDGHGDSWASNAGQGSIGTSSMSVPGPGQANPVGADRPR
jgi:hypothetical protein